MKLVEVLVSRRRSRFIPLVIVLGLLSHSRLTVAASSGPNSGSSFTEVNSGGSNISGWTNVNNAIAQDNGYASLITTTKNKETYYLKASGFGFSIPAGSSIDGIVVEVERYGTVSVGGASISDATIQLVDYTGSIEGNNKSTNATWPGSDLNSYASYGGTGDTWGIAGLTWDRINDADFGVVISSQTSNTNSCTFSMYVDHIRVTVYYTSGGVARYAVANGNWNSTAVWSLTSGGPSGASVPAASNDVFIEGGYTVDINAAAFCNSIRIGTSSNGIINFNTNNMDLTVGTGGVTIAANGNITGTASGCDLRSSGNLSINSILTNTAFILTLQTTPNLVISGTGTIGKLNVQSLTTNNAVLTVTDTYGGNDNDLINGASGTFIFSGCNMNASIDCNTSGNTIEASNPAACGSWNLRNIATTFYNLVISGTATKYFNGGISIVGDLNIKSGAVLSNSSNEDIVINGNWINNNGSSGWIPGTGRVLFTEIASQSITNASGETFYRLHVNKSANTLILNNNITVTNTLALQGGNVNLNNQTLTLGNNAGATLSRTAGTIYGGTFKRWFPTGAINSTSGSYYGLFPLGTATGYRPIQINTTSNVTTAGYISASHSDAVTVTDVNYNDGGTIIQRIHNARSTLSTSGSTLSGGTYSISMTLTNLITTGSSALSDIRLATYTGAVIGAVGTHAAATGSVTSPTARRTGLSAANLSNVFAIGSTNKTNSPLPVTLLSFGASVTHHQVALSWITSTERNNDYFTIERTKDGTVFEEISVVKGAGNSNEPKYYTAVDTEPWPGVSYYRLKQTDFDGKFQYHGVRMANVPESGTSEIFVYPNPASSLQEVHIDRSGLALTDVVVDIFDAFGKKLYTKHLPALDKGSISIAHTGIIKPGMYVLKFSTGNKTSYQKLVIR